MTERVRIGATILAAESLGLEINYKPYAEKMIRNQDPPRTLIAAIANEAYRLEALAREIGNEAGNLEGMLSRLRNIAFELVPRPSIENLLGAYGSKIKFDFEKGGWKYAIDYCDAPWTYLTDYRGFQLHARLAAYGGSQGCQYMITDLKGNPTVTSELFPLQKPEIAIRTGLIDIEKRYEQQKQRLGI